MAKTPWLQRLELLESLNLNAVAAELNERRLLKLRERLDGTLSPRERRKMRRLIELHAAGELELPSDLKANGLRMARVLRTLHELIGSNWQDVTRSVEAIAERMGVSVTTARRGVIDLDEASILMVKRVEKRRGGQGPSEYRIAWANARNIAIEQGVQKTFDFGESSESAELRRTPGAGESSDRSSRRTKRTGESSDALAAKDAPVEPAERETAEDRRPDESSGSRARGSAASHSGSAASHSGSAASHSGSALRTARAETPFLDPFPDPPPPEGAGASLSWEGVRDRLWRYGLGTARRAATIARQHGWTVAQVAGLLDRCERQSVGEIRAYDPGAVWWQLVNGPPGSEITLPPRERYVRAKRDAAIAAESRRQAAVEEVGAAASAERARLEERFGAALDGVSDLELDGLLEAAGVTREQCAQAAKFGGPRFGLLRPTLLRVLHQQQFHQQEVTHGESAERN